MTENWEELSLFQNRPHTTLEFEKQLDKIFQWMSAWDYEKKCGITEQLLQFCNYVIIRFLWTVLEPMVHRDFIYNKMDPFSQNNFHTLSSYVSRELYTRLEKIVNKYRRKRREVYRIPSSIVKSEDEVRGWTSESVLPVIRGHDVENVQESRMKISRSKANSYPAKSSSTLPSISTSTNTMTSTKSSKHRSLNAIPLRHQTKQRHLQKDEICWTRLDKQEKYTCKNSHERSHMKTIIKARSCSALDHYDEEPRVSRQTRSQTALGIPLSAFATKDDLKSEDRLIMQWFRDKWNDWQKKEFLQLFLQTLDTSQIYLLYGLIMVRLYRDFISSLPKPLSIKILSYLSPQDLLVVAKVCQSWNERASDDLLWEGKCKERRVASAAQPQLNWRDMYLKYESLEDNWRKGRYNMTEFQGHMGSVTAVQLFKNILASGSVDKTIKLWNINTGDLIQTLKGHTQMIVESKLIKAYKNVKTKSIKKGVWGLRFMSKTLLISCSNDQTIKIWNLRTGVCARTFLGHDGGVWCIERKGDLLVSGSMDKTARLWNLRHCRLKTTFTGHVGAIFGIDFDPGRDAVFTGSADRTIRMWSMSTSDCLKCIMVSTNNLPVTAIGYHQGKLACCFGQVISVLDTFSWESLSILEGHRDRIETLQMSSRNISSTKTIQVLVSCSRDGKIKYWDVNAGTCLHSFKGHEDAITNVIFDDTKIVTASQDCTLRLWNFLN